MFNLSQRMASRAIAFVLLTIAIAACLACSTEVEIERAGRSVSDEERRERASDAKAPFGLANDIPTATIAPTPNAVSRTSGIEPADKKPFGLPAEIPAVDTTTTRNPTQIASAVELTGNDISPDNNLLALVPDDAIGVGTIDMNSPMAHRLIALYDIEAPEAELALYLEVFKELFDTDTIIFASVENGELFIIPGVFDGLGYALESEGYARQTYLGFEVWEGYDVSGSMGELVAITEGQTISGPSEVVRDVLDRVASGSGLMAHNRDSEIEQVMNRTGKGMFVFASVEDCDTDDCKAVCVAISMDDDSSAVDMKFVMLFSNEYAAKSAVTEAESQSYFDDDLLYIEVRRDRKIVIVDTAFEEENFWRGFWDAIEDGISAEMFPGTDA